MKSLPLLFLILALAACGATTSQWAGGTDSVLPSIPGGLTALAASATRVNLSWNASTDNIAVTDYVIRRNGTQVGTSSTTTYSDTSVSAGKTYSYTVSSRDAAGNVSPDSPAKSVTTPIPQGDNTPPSVPTNLVATPGSTSVSLTWTASTDNFGVAGYAIFRNGSQIAISTTPSYTDSCLSPSTSFTYSVAAFDAASNNSAQTAGVPATTGAATANPTVLSQAAAALQPGQWTVPFAMGGLNQALVSANGPSVPTLLGFASRGHWDCAHRTLQFTGTSHTGGLYIAGAGGLLTYNEQANQWTKESYTWSVYDPGHSYYQNTLNKTNGDLYFRQFNSATVYRRAFGTTGQASWQAGQVANIPNNANQVAGGLEWFPQLNNGAGGLVFVDTFGASWSNATLTSWQSTPNNLTSGQIHNWIALAGGFVYWGGGGDTTTMYRLSPTGVATQMPDTPIGTGVNENSGVVLAHPNGTDLLLFGTSAGGPIYRFDGSTWTNIGTHQIGGQLWVGFTIPDYGVMLFLRHENVGTGNGSAALFKP